MSAPTNEGRYLATLPRWERDLARPIHRAVYNAAIGMSDALIADVVKHALACARRDLSS